MVHAAFVAFVLFLARMTAPDHVPVPPAEPQAQAQTVDYARDVQPIFERNCKPCHFPGGSMHAKLPFDEGATITKLGEKVFSRIKKEEDQKIIRAFLERMKEEGGTMRKTKRRDSLYVSRLLQPSSIILPPS